MSKPIKEWLISAIKTNKTIKLVVHPAANVIIDYDLLLKKLVKDNYVSYLFDRTTVNDSDLPEEFISELTKSENINYNREYTGPLEATVVFLIYSDEEKTNLI